MGGSPLTQSLTWGEEIRHQMCVDHYRVWPDSTRVLNYERARGGGGELLWVLCLCGDVPFRLSRGLLRYSLPDSLKSSVSWERDMEGKTSEYVVGKKPRHVSDSTCRLVPKGGRWPGWACIISGEISSQNGFVGPCSTNSSCSQCRTGDNLCVVCPC